MYATKSVLFKGRRKCICLQDKNGPCPLIAITNVLVLRGDISLPQDQRVEADFLFELLGNVLLESNRQKSDENTEKLLDDVVSVFPKLQTGLDMNLRFDSVFAFEYTKEQSVFDAFRVPLVHGWLPDPEDSRLYEKMSSLSYNQAVELALSAQMDELDVGESERAVDMMVGEFLESSKSQLTFYGLSQLYACIRDDQLAVLFRNNHFSTVYKNGDRLFALLTDESFGQLDHVVWEELLEVQGDTQYLNSEFVLSRLVERSVPEEERNDRLIAEQLQKEEVQRERAKMRKAREAMNESKPRKERSQSGGCVVV